MISDQLEAAVLRPLRSAMTFVYTIYLTHCKCSIIPACRANGARQLAWNWGMPFARMSTSDRS